MSTKWGIDWRDKGSGEKGMKSELVITDQFEEMFGEIRMASDSSGSLCLRLSLVLSNK
jgi:hypothetical protein